MMMRHALLLTAVFAISALSAGEGEGAVVPVYDEVDKSVDAGLAWLASQQKADGSWPGPGGSERNMNAVSGLAVLAFMASGNVPGEGRYGAVVQKGIDFIASRQSTSGYFGGDGSRMYGHGICTLALVEALGMSSDRQAFRKFKPVCERALALILRAQAVPKPQGQAGGWRYDPSSGDSDLSLTGWQIMALRAGQNDGFQIPKDSVKNAVAYVRASYNGQGGFGYQTNQGQSDALRGLGMLVLQLLGEHDSDEAKAAAKIIAQTPVQWGGRWFYYGLYYRVQGMNQVGGKEWEAYRGKVETLLRQNQSSDGSWPFPSSSEEQGEAGPIYPTAMALLTLSVRYKVLPIYQR
jgi:hypothetical protein